jgi:hypothetical protein
LVVFETHCTKLAEHISYLWLILMLIAQSMAFTFATLNQLIWDQCITSTFIMGIIYVISIKKIYEPQMKIEEKLIERKILTDN